MESFTIIEAPQEKDYELLDSGDGEKLERYNEVILSRPDPQALWPKRFPESVWRRAQARFLHSPKGAHWDISPGTPAEWQIGLGGLRFWVKPTSFKHTGVFPEQVPNWNWMREVIQAAGRPITVLNLFGYTGGATLTCLNTGATVVHVDASKVAISWAKRDAEASGLADRPVRWILDDAATFVKREIKRGHRYDGIVMDPPAFGRGADGELWKIEDGLLPLLSSCRTILSAQPLFFLINGYASGYSAVAYKNNLDAMMKQFGGEVKIGELTLRESGLEGRLLPAGIFARWRTT